MTCFIRKRLTEGAWQRACSRNVPVLFEVFLGGALPEGQQGGQRPSVHRPRMLHKQVATSMHALASKEGYHHLQPHAAKMYILASVLLRLHWMGSHFNMKPKFQLLHKVLPVGTCCKVFGDRNHLYLLFSSLRNLSCLDLCESLLTLVYTDITELTWVQSAIPHRAKLCHCHYLDGQRMISHLQSRVTNFIPCTWRPLFSIFHFLASKFFWIRPWVFFNSFLPSQHCTDLGCGQQNSSATFLTVTPAAREEHWGSPVSSAGAGKSLQKEPSLPPPRWNAAIQASLSPFLTRD